MAEHTMLLVDDVDMNLEILETIFEEHFRILKAHNGIEALDILKHDKVDIVILDIVMPVMDGFETLERIRSDKALMDIPVVVSTAEGGENEERALIDGADDFIVKPYSPVVVYKRVENILVKHVLEQQKLRDALVESKEEYNSLADSVSGGISVWKVTDKVEVLYFNDGLCEIIGCTRDELSALYKDDLSRILHPDDYKNVMDKLRRTKELGYKINSVHRIRKKNGEVIWVNLTAVLYKIEDGAPIYRAVEVDVTESKNNELLIEQQNQELSHALEYDSLTDIYNWRGFCNRTAIFLQEHDYRDYVIMKLDIERFKVINELYGMAIGDKILCAVAECMEKCLKGAAVYGRLDADNFAICMPDDKTYIADVREAIQSSVRAAFIYHNTKVYFGIYPITDKNMPVDLMCDRATLALETVKGQYSRNYAVFDEKLHQKVLLEQEFNNEMDWALKTGQFHVYIQPVVSLDTGKIVSGEALIRWFHPEKGIISPGDFIPFFERNGFIVKLDAYIREEVVKNLEKTPVSVNISRLEFYAPEFSKNLIALVEKHHVDPSLLRLEITESAYMDDPEQLLREMDILRRSGFKILIDDFGSGYSSLNMLKDASADIIKLDMKFLSGNDSYGREKNILASMVRMAREIGMETVAEGIETEEQAAFLKKMGCEYGQGYYYAKPMPLEEFLKKVEDTRLN